MSDEWKDLLFTEIDKATKKYDTVSDILGVIQA